MLEQIRDVGEARITENMFFWLKIEPRPSQKSIKNVSGTQIDQNVLIVAYFLADRRVFDDSGVSQEARI